MPGYIELAIHEARTMVPTSALTHRIFKAEGNSVGATRSCSLVYHERAFEPHMSCDQAPLSTEVSYCLFQQMNQWTTLHGHQALASQRHAPARWSWPRQDVGDVGSADDLRSALQACNFPHISVRCNRGSKQPAVT